MYILRWSRRGHEYSPAMYRHKNAEWVMTWLEEVAECGRLSWVEIRGRSFELLLDYDEKENVEAGL